MGWNGLVSENSIIFFMTTAKRNLPSECNGIVGRPGISAARWRGLTGLLIDRIPGLTPGVLSVAAAPLIDANLKRWSLTSGTESKWACRPQRLRLDLGVPAVLETPRD